MSTIMQSAGELQRLAGLLRYAVHLPGDVAECGVHKGGTASYLLPLIPKTKRLLLFDAWEVPSTEATQHEQCGVNQDVWCAGTPPEVVALAGANKNVIIKTGWFSDTLPLANGPLCFLHADADLESSTEEIVEFAHRAMVPGGVVVFHDYRPGHGAKWPGVKRAVDSHLDVARFLLLQPSGRSKQAIALRYPL